jgi:hypothetical protein
MLVLFNHDKRIFIRYGGNENSGVPKKELVLVDENGNIDESTPLLFNYEKITSITAYRIDFETLTLENATITSRASRVNLIDQYHSIARGIRVVRSNTHIKNIEHKITGEIFKGELLDGVPFIGHSYNGILSIQSCHNILIENFIFQARAYYLQGTYDLTANMSNKLLFKNCGQSNFFGNHMPEYPLMPAFGKWWGVAGTNYCKNMVYDGCNMTRYDAHQGVVNGKILNCTIASIRLTGGGDMQIENTKIYYTHNFSPLQLREDYGCTWRGTVTLKNCEFLDAKGEGALNHILVTRSANWNFGYTTYFPNIVIDNLKIENAKPEMALLYDFDMSIPQTGFLYRSVKDPALAKEGEISADGKPNVNPYTPPEFIKIINNEQNGYDISVPEAPFLENTTVTGAKRK